MKKLLRLTIFILSITTLASAQNVSIPAQIPELEEQVSIFVEPELPKPNEQVEIKVEAYGTDLTRAFITWKVNGITKKSGRGEQTFSLNSGTAGTKQTVLIQIQPFGGPLIQKTLVFEPQEVDMLWEARSYTPPFYKGKSLPGYMGTVKMVAIPQFKNGNVNISPINKTFRWSKNYELINESSGFNKNSLTISGDILLKPETISVEVSDDNLRKARKDTEINFFEPTLLAYENNPLYGILFNKSISDISLQNREISISAIPFFFETESKKTSNMKFSWRVNGNESFLFTKDSATFRYNSNEQGTSLIDIVANHTNNFLQEARLRFNIQLKNE